MAEGIIRQFVRATDPVASPIGYVDFYCKNGQYFFIDDGGVITAIPLDSEAVQDIVGAMMVGGNGIDATYNDGSNTLTIDIDSATSLLISNAIQPGDNVSELANDSGYVDSVGAASAAPVQSVNGNTGTVVLDKTDVGLGNVDNTSDVNKPVSSATQTALDAKVDESVEINSVSGETTGGGDLTSDRTIGLADTAVTAGSYSSANITVDAKGRITDATDGSTIFNSEFQTEVSPGQSSTTSTNFQLKLNMTTPSVPAGTYRIGWKYGWSCSSTSDDFEARIQLNNSTDVMDHIQEPKDAGTDQLLICSGFEYITVASAGVQSFDLDYRTEDGSSTSFIREARLEFWRVS